MRCILLVLATVGPAMGGLACAGHRVEAPARPSLTVEPDSALVDVPVVIRARGLGAGAAATIRSTTRVDSLHVLTSWARFLADERGEVDVSRQAPVEGAYAGIDAMGLFWSMTADTMRVVPGQAVESFEPPRPYGVDLELVVGGRAVAAARALRRFLAPDVAVVEVREAEVVGKLFLPAGGVRPPVVIVLSGSEGGIPEVRAALLASHGFAALALAYFKEAGLPEELFEIPVESVSRGISWLRTRPDVDAGRIAVLGGSKGAELALLAAATIPEIGAVVAYAPSAYVWPGITRTGGSREQSSWTIGGQPVPFVPHVATPEFEAQFRGPPPYRLRLLYEPSVADTVAAARAAIPVERIRGPVLLVAGDDDQMGPSCEMAHSIVRRLERNGHPRAAVELCYPGAGHAIAFPYVPTPPRERAGPFALGGTSEGTARAEADSWPRVLRFLEESLGR